ncbi:sensor histidine kinase [Thiohalomonas denitrificans]|uniref:histidine kinase n=1 Tax=Thiohalomonas denitrificans TaxID=415747 RepID=A0A1G5PLM1_9GAMM|nr:ATP-binding protein [Thiohalomonas denitrificans]SCZ50338.1 two-component system, NtrC family, sensor histidine kinase PilS [Thiohalomonas denitrificans]
MDGSLTTAPLSLSSPENSAKTWQPLRFFNIYRLLLSSAFVFLASDQRPPMPLGAHDPGFFLNVSIAYVIFAAISIILSERRQPAFPIQLYVQVAGDITALTLLMHASGGVASGLGMLLVVCIANASMITGGRTAGLFAAVATIALLLEQLYSHLTVPDAAVAYPQSGLLGAALFATAALAHVLSRHARASEVLAEQREMDLANMAQMAEFIIEHMQTGVVVVDNYQRVQLMNVAARRLLSSTSSNTRYLGEVSPDLAQRVARWLQGGQRPRTVKLEDVDYEVIPRFMNIGPDGRAGTLIFLEDASLAARQVQQLKLAALGRLTASVAHEVRNPLGAISHAGQLLAESPHLDKTDQRMTEIVLEQSQRVNTIIESILQLGRKDRSKMIALTLSPFVKTLIAEFCYRHDIDAGKIPVAIPPDLEIGFDPTHLQQILSNLLDNAERHSRTSDFPRIRLKAGYSKTGRPYLDIVNKGEGIPDSVANQLFEPFFTTQRSGIGLGLYISRELAECNNAELAYLPDKRGGSRFRLSFSHPSR